MYFMVCCFTYPSIMLTAHFVSALRADRALTRTSPFSPILLRVRPKTKDQTIRPNKLVPSTYCPTSRTSVAFCNNNTNSLNIIVWEQLHVSKIITAIVNFTKYSSEWQWKIFTVSRLEFCSSALISYSTLSVLYYYNNKKNKLVFIS